MYSAYIYIILPKVINWISIFWGGWDAKDRWTVRESDQTTRGWMALCQLATRDLLILMLILEYL